jgi:hypothetical protein
MYSADFEPTQELLPPMKPAIAEGAIGQQPPTAT